VKHRTYRRPGLLADSGELVLTGLRELLPEDPGRGRDRARPALPVSDRVAGPIQGQCWQVAHRGGLPGPSSRPGFSPADRSDPVSDRL